MPPSSVDFVSIPGMDTIFNELGRVSVELETLLQLHNFIQPDTIRPRSTFSAHPEIEDERELLYHHRNKSSTMPTKNNSTMGRQAAETDQQETQRGWRFYGTFASLGLLNFVCAIDATILSVALPVRIFSFCYLRIVSRTHHLPRPLRQNFMELLLKLSGAVRASCSVQPSSNRLGRHSPI